MAYVAAFATIFAAFWVGYMLGRRDFLGVSREELLKQFSTGTISAGVAECKITLTKAEWGKIVVTAVASAIRLAPYDKGKPDAAEKWVGQVGLTVADELWRVFLSGETDASV